MRRIRFLRGKGLVGVLAVLLLLVLAGGWYAHDSLLAWYYVQRLSAASEADRGGWAERLAALDETASPRLRQCLRQQEPRVCENAQAGFLALAARWPADDLRRGQLAVALAETYSQYSLAGQCTVLELFAAWLSPEVACPSEGLVLAACKLVPQAGKSPDPEVRGRAVAVAGAILNHDKNNETVTACRELIRRGLQDAEAENRAVAARMAARKELNLLPQVAPLLDDPTPVVRQAAMLAVGPHEMAVATDDLLRSLHDTDEDVRRLCEAALKSRGLRSEDVLLGRLISDSQPGVRLQVLDNLRKAADLEPGVWLRRLSHDPSPAVRAAAVRAAGDERQLDFSDRLTQMAQTDPSPTVRQLAQYYLTRQKQP